MRDESDPRFLPLSAAIGSWIDFDLIRVYLSVSVAQIPL